MSENLAAQEERAERIEILFFCPPWQRHQLPDAERFGSTGETAPGGHGGGRPVASLSDKNTNTAYKAAVHSSRMLRVSVPRFEEIAYETRQQ